MESDDDEAVKTQKKNGRFTRQFIHAQLRLTLKCDYYINPICIHNGSAIEA
jgi:hypothetical protein